MAALTQIKQLVVGVLMGFLYVFEKQGPESSLFPQFFKVHSTFIYFTFSIIPLPFVPKKQLSYQVLVTFVNYNNTQYFIFAIDPAL